MVCINYNTFIHKSLTFELIFLVNPHVVYRLRGFLVHVGRNFDRVNHQHRVGRPIKIDAHILLPALLAEMCLGVCERLLNDRRLDVDQTVLQQRSANQREVFSARHKNLVAEFYFIQIFICRMPNNADEPCPIEFYRRSLVASTLRRV